MMEDSESEITLIGFDIFGFPQDGSAEITITQNPENGSIGTPQFEPSSTNQIVSGLFHIILNQIFLVLMKLNIKSSNNDSESDEGQYQYLLLK